MNIKLEGFYSILHNEKRLKEKMDSIINILNSKEAGDFFFTEEKTPDLIANIILTGGTENLFLSKIKKMEEPIIIFYDNTDNSLAATLEIKTKLQDLGKKVIVLSVYDSSKKIDNILKASYTKNILKESKIGSIGIPSSWLIASIPDRDSVRERFGIEIVDIELQELYNEVKKVKTEEILPIKEEFVNSAENIGEPTDEDLNDAIKIYIALKNIIVKYNLSGLTLSCFTILDVLKNTGCFALSKLNDEGIIAGCEGDLQSAITMFIAYKLTGEIPFMANPSDINLEENTLTLAHCTIARKLLKSYIIRSHFESGIGVGIQGDLNTEEVTLFRIGGKKMDKHVLFTGEKIPMPHSENLCRTQIKIKVNENISHLIENPVGNHLIIIKNNYKDIIQTFLKTF